MTQPQPDAGNVEFAPAIMASFRQGAQLLEQALFGIRREWEALIRRITLLLTRVQKELNNDSIWATISEWWTEQIVDAVVKVRELVEDIGQKVNQILQAVEKAVDGSVPVGSLFAAGLDYSSRVLPKLSDIGNDMRGSGAVDHWRGPTKITYEKRVRDQIDAVTSTVGKVKATSNWLAEVAAANTAYLVSLADRAATIVGELVAVVIDATETASGAVTQIVITLQHLSEFIGTVVTNSLQYLTNLATRLAEVVKQITSLANEVGDHSGLPGGKWPQAVNP